MEKTGRGIYERCKDTNGESEEAIAGTKRIYRCTAKDGLIDKDKRFSIEWKNGGDLYINGTKQSKEISEKYRKYYKEDGYEFNFSDGKEGESI